MPGSVVSTRSKSLRRFGCAVGHDDLSRVLTVADAHAAAVMETHPRRAAHRIDQRIQDRPIADGIRAVAHRFGFAVRRSDRSRIEMIAPDHDRRGDFAIRDQFVEFQSGLMRSP